MKRKLSYKKNLRSKQHRTIKSLVFLSISIAILTTIFAYQNTNKTSAASAKEICLAAADNEAKRTACDIYDDYPNGTVSVSAEWLSNDPSCTYGATAKVKQDGSASPVYICTAVFTGARTDRENADFEAYNVNFSSGYVTDTNLRLAEVTGEGKNTWTNTTAQQITLNTAQIINDYKNGTLDSCLDYDISSDMHVEGQKKTINTTATSPLCIEVEEPQCDEGKALEKDANGNFICKEVTTTESEEVYISRHKTAPGEYKPHVLITKLNFGLTQNNKYNKDTNPKTYYLPLTPNLIDKFDFYPADENPITTSDSIAYTDAIRTIINAVDGYMVFDSIKLCGKYNGGGTVELGKIGIEAAAEVIDKFLGTSTSDFLELIRSWFGISEGNPEDAALLAAQAAICDVAVTKAYGEGLLNMMVQNIQSKPTPLVSEGSIDLQPGEDGIIYAYATIPSASVYYTYTVAYTQYFQTKTETSTGLDGTGGSSSSKKILVGMNSKVLGIQRHYDVKSGKYEIARDSRKIRRLGNIYGTEFRTRLLSVDKNTFTGTVTPPGSGAYTEATVTNPPENLDN
ncbi:hypothetical protein IKG45_03410, partial [Candidatus Saccharibacteria bacterium]|nr:hypothetical protein [Candidatus Saccharibacteria bacterium]